jgi:DNA-binding NarL/FixJ family response regulator
MNVRTALQVGLVEDDPVLRASVRRVLAQRADWTLALEADCCVAAAAPPQLDVLLLDIGLPDGSGLELIAGFAARGCKVVVFTVMGDEATVLRAIEAGAAGYLLKHAEADEMLAAIDEVMAGGAPLTPSVAAHLLARLRTPARPGTPPPADSGLSTLTAREQEVLLALARGYTYGETAELLQISAHTVGDHVKKIYTKLAVRSRAEAVFEVVQAGWLSRD